MLQATRLSPIVLALFIPIVSIGCTTWSPRLSDRMQAEQTSREITEAETEDIRDHSADTKEQTFDNIAAAEHIVVNDQKLIVKGSVGDGVHLENNCSAYSTISININGTSISVNGNQVNIRSGDSNINGTSVSVNGNQVNIRSGDSSDQNNPIQ
ncbi:MAG: hypothetical protein F6K10_09495, partial [Moorea sp. SIO2B7]|nr:hypothetical protein [Moorena sp. SIO2B7]